MPRSLEHALELVQQPLLGGRRSWPGRRAGCCRRARSVTRFSGSGRSSVDSQKSTACRATLSSVHSGRQPRLQRLLAAVHLGLRLADHLDVAQRVVDVVGAEVEVVEAQRLLEDRRVGLLRERQHGRAVVEHVVAPDLVGAVRQAVGMLVAGRREQQLARCWPPRTRRPRGRAVCVSCAPSRSTTTPVTARARRVGLQPDGLGVGQQRDVRVLERRAHAEHLGVGLRVHQAREAVAGRAAHARAVGHVALVQHDAARRVERLVPGRREVVGELLDARLVAHRRERVGRARRRLGRILAARAVHLVELLGRACSTARARRSRSATPARCRRGGAARRSPPCAGGTAPRRRASSRRRRSSAPGAGTACRRRRTRCPATRSGSRRRRRARASSAARAAASRRARAAGCACPTGRAGARACRRRRRCR